MRSGIPKSRTQVETILHAGKVTTNDQVRALTGAILIVADEMTALRELASKLELANARLLDVLVKQHGAQLLALSELVATMLGELDRADS